MIKDDTTGSLVTASGQRYTVKVRHEYGDRYLACLAGRWRRVHIRVNRLFIVLNGERITIEIDGV